MLVQQFLDGILLSPAPTNQLHDPLRPEFLGGAVGVNRRSLYTNGTAEELGAERIVQLICRRCRWCKSPLAFCPFHFRSPRPESCHTCSSCAWSPGRGSLRLSGSRKSPPPPG